jgi:hypothetical protein
MSPETPSEMFGNQAKIPGNPNFWPGLTRRPPFRHPAAFTFSQPRLLAGP